MTKRQIIDEIQQYNPTATGGFLARFEDSELREYLEHLRNAHTPRPIRSEQRSTPARAASTGGLATMVHAIWQPGPAAATCMLEPEVDTLLDDEPDLFVDDYEPAIDEAVEAEEAIEQAPAEDAMDEPALTGPIDRLQAYWPAKIEPTDESAEPEPEPEAPPAPPTDARLWEDPLGESAEDASAEMPEAMEPATLAEENLPEAQAEDVVEEIEPTAETSEEPTPAEPPAVAFSAPSVQPLGDEDELYEVMRELVDDDAQTPHDQLRDDLMELIDDVTGDRHDRLREAVVELTAPAPEAAPSAVKQADGPQEDQNESKSHPHGVTETFLF